MPRHGNSLCFLPFSLSSSFSDPRHSQHTLVGIEVKDAAGIAGMRHACAEASYIRAFAGSCVVVGRSTDEIDALVHEEVCRIGLYPSPLGYADFPKSICTSVNQVVVHGIPDARKLEEGDIVNIDVSIYVPEGYHGDCSGMVSTTCTHILFFPCDHHMMSYLVSLLCRLRPLLIILYFILTTLQPTDLTAIMTRPSAHLFLSPRFPLLQFVAGTADPLAEKLLSTTRACLDGAIALCGPGVPFNAIGAFIQPMAHAAGFSVVKQFCGHGIGKIFHMPPLVYHCVNHVTDLMQPGMTFTIEPMLNEGTPDIKMLDDGWTYLSCDGGRSAQYEETILITETGCEILTKHTRPLPNQQQ